MSARLVTRDLFGFLAALRQHNDRAWFTAHRKRYLTPGARSAPRPGRGADAEAARDQPRLVVDPRPSGGSLMRIHRDTRFSADKRPYKTNAALHFRVAAPKDVEAPGYYLHLEPGHVFMGAGLWRPGGDALRAIRGAIVADPGGWKRARRSGLSHGEA
jgi:uncharacterized protein (TIGR02453 family)